MGIQAGITFSQGAALPSYCASGKLALEGSTAFAPTAQKIAEKYTSVCRGTTISVSGITWFSGLNAVAAQVGGPSAGAGGAADPASGRAVGVEQMAMSDRQAPEGYSALYGNPVAVILFAVVVNKATDIYNLTTAQLYGIFMGRFTNWKQVGGADLPIKIVARTTTSGTRRTFDDKILGGQAEPQFSSYDCVKKDAVPTAKVTRCEVSDTNTLLQDVNSIPGAIGYAQVSDAQGFRNGRNSISEIKIDGQDPTFNAAQADTYPVLDGRVPLYRRPSAGGSLEADFLGYINGAIADNILFNNDYTPCVDGVQSLMKTLC